MTLNQLYNWVAEFNILNHEHLEVGREGWHVEFTYWNWDQQPRVDKKTKQHPWWNLCKSVCPAVKVNECDVLNSNMNSEAQSFNAAVIDVRQYSTKNKRASKLKFPRQNLKKLFPSENENNAHRRCKKSGSNNDYPAFSHLRRELGKELDRIRRTAPRYLWGIYGWNLPMSGSILISYRKDSKVTPSVVIDDSVVSDPSDLRDRLGE